MLIIFFTKRLPWDSLLYLFSQYLTSLFVFFPTRQTMMLHPHPSSMVWCTSEQNYRQSNLHLLFLFSKNAYKSYVELRSILKNICDTLDHVSTLFLFLFLIQFNEKTLKISPRYSRKSGTRTTLTSAHLTLIQSYAISTPQRL